MTRGSRGFGSPALFDRSHAVLLAGRLLCSATRRPPAMPTASGAVELVMLEQQGAGVPAAPHGRHPPSPRPRHPRPLRRRLPAPARRAGDPPTRHCPCRPPPPGVSPRAPPACPPRHPAGAARAAEAPQIKLGGNSDTNAIVIGGPQRDPGQRRCEVPQPGAGLSAGGGAPRRAGCGDPADPCLAGGSAVRRGHRGELRVHVLLDRAARDAVLGWHFVPAVQDGQPIPFEMTLRVVFNLE